VFQILMLTPLFDVIPKYNIMPSFVAWSNGVVVIWGKFLVTNTFLISLLPSPDIGRYLLSILW